MLIQLTHAFVPPALRGSTLPAVEARPFSCALAAVDAAPWVGPAIVLAILVALLLASTAAAGVLIFWWGMKCGREGRAVSPFDAPAPEVTVDAVPGSPAAVAFRQASAAGVDDEQPGDAVREHPSPPPRI